MPTGTPKQGNMVLEGLNLCDLVKDCLACGIVSVDARRRVNAFDATAELFTGLDASKMLGEPLAALPPPLPVILAETLETGRPARNYQFALRHAEGHELVLGVNTIPLGHTSGNIVGAVAVLCNLTSAGNLSAKARRLEQLASIGALSAGMAHEIKNALVPLKTFVELLLKKQPEAELAGVAGKEMRRLDAIISQMLRFAGPARPTFAPVRVHKLLDHCLRALQYQFEAKQIAVRRHLEAASDCIHGDHYQLEQAFINLLLNALEAMEPNGVLTATTSLMTETAGAPLPPAASAPRLCIQIQDTGAGIAAEHLDRLFEPFFTTKSKGTGLGLAITRRIIQDHNGAITVQSEARRGTAFNISLPLLQETCS